METLQPILRFPGFEGDWISKKLIDISVKIKDGTHFSPKTSTDINDFQYLTSKNVKNGYIDFSNLQYITREDHEKIYKSCDVKIGDVLLTKDGTIGQVCVNYLDYEFSLLSSVAYIRVKEKFNNYFLYHLLVSEIGQNEINKAIAGQALKRITLTKINDFIFNFPSLEEQTRIANFLSSIDEKINLLKEKKELLEEYKKGIMQKIFNQEIRFKPAPNETSGDDNGNDFEDWEEKSLGSLCKITTGKLDANAMVEDGEYRFYTCAKDYFRIDKYAFDTEALLISGNGANVGYIHYYKGKFNAYQRTYILDGFKENIIYIKYFLQMNLPKRIKGEKNDGNTPYIVLSTLSEMEFLIPCFEEQTKIANFLSAIDEKIELVANQIEDTQEYKKGLLQQMFV